MKRTALLKHLRRQGCYLKREGSSHSLWCNPLTGAIEAVPRHVEISNRLARSICKNLTVPEATLRLRVFALRISISRWRSTIAIPGLVGV